MDYIPQSDYLLLVVEPPKAYAEYEGLTHIVVPDRYAHGPKDRPVIGIVEKIGPQCLDKNLSPGVRVYVAKWRGVYLEDRTKMICREQDVLAIDV